MSEEITLAATVGGVDATHVTALAKRLAMRRAALLSMLGISPTSFRRRVREGNALTPIESSKVMFIVELIALVRRVVAESGDSNGFDAAKWLGAWLLEPLPALGGRRPANYMDCLEGQQLVATIIARMQTGAYS